MEARNAHKWLFLCVGLLCNSVILQAQKQLTHLPTLYVETVDGSDDIAHSVYKDASLTLVDGKDTLRYPNVQIRGRGNSTWVQMKKKPYRLKFPKKTRFLGTERANAKKWNLLANAADKTLIRNALTFKLGELVGLPFNPGSGFVDFYLNGVYRGNYQLTDNVDVRERRVDVYEQEFPPEEETADITGGYLLEVDGFASSSDIYFLTDKQIKVRIHSPSDFIVQRQIDYIQQYVQHFEDALFSTQATDPNGGWTQYVDSTTLFAWYIASEISANPDAFWSTYFYKERGDGRFFWGPLWDYDIAWNNSSRMGNTVERLMSVNSFGWGQAGQWVRQMWKDPWFARGIYYTYRDLYHAGLETKLLALVDSLALHIHESAMENYKVWSISEKVYEERFLYDTYDDYIQELKKFIQRHTYYLLRAFRLRCPDGAPPPIRADSTVCYRFYNQAAPETSLCANWETTGFDVPVCLMEDKSDRRMQQWILHSEGSFFRITNAQTGMALADPATDEPFAVQLATRLLDRGDDRQLWRILSAPAKDCYYLQNAYTERLAANPHNPTMDGDDVMSFPRGLDGENLLGSMWIIEKSPPIPEGTIVDIQLPHSDEEYSLCYDPVAHRLHVIYPPATPPSFHADVYGLDGRWHGQFGLEGYDARNLPTGIYIVSWSNQGRQRSVRFSR